MWNCPNCKRKNKPQFDLCARCGVNRDGQPDPFLQELCQWRKRLVQGLLAAFALITLTASAQTAYFTLSPATESIPLRVRIEKHRSSLMRVVNAVKERGEADSEFTELQKLFPNIGRIRADEHGNVLFCFDNISMAETGFAYSETKLDERLRMNAGAHHLFDGWWMFIQY